MELPSIVLVHACVIMSWQSKPVLRRFVARHAKVNCRTDSQTAEVRAPEQASSGFRAKVGVVCDLGALTTLSPHDYVTGLAEVIKAGFIADPRILELVEVDPGCHHARRSAHPRARRARAPLLACAIQLPACRL